MHAVVSACIRCCLHACMRVSSRMDAIFIIAYRYRPPLGVSKVRNVYEEAKHGSVAPWRGRSRETGWETVSPGSSISSEEFWNGMKSRHSGELCSVPPSPLPPPTPFVRPCPLPKEIRDALKITQRGLRSLLLKRSTSASSNSSGITTQISRKAAPPGAVYATVEGHVVDGRNLLKKGLSLDCSINAEGEMQHSWQLEHQQASLMLQNLLQDDPEEEQGDKMENATETHHTDRMSLCSSSNRYDHEIVFRLSPRLQRERLLLSGTGNYPNSRDRGEATCSIIQRRVVSNAPCCNASVPCGIGSTSSIRASPRSGKDTPTISEVSLYSYRETEATSKQKMEQRHGVSPLAHRSKNAERLYNNNTNSSSSGSSSSSSTSSSSKSRSVPVPKAICPPLKKAASSMPPLHKKPQEPQHLEATATIRGIKDLSLAMEELLKEMKTNTLRVQRRMQKNESPKQQPQEQQEAQSDKRGLLPAVPKARQQTENEGQQLRRCNAIRPCVPSRLLRLRL